MNARLCPKVVSVQFKTVKTCTRKKSLYKNMKLFFLFQIPFPPQLCV